MGNKKTTKDIEKVTQEIKTERRTYFVPNYGAIEAEDLPEVEKKLKELKEQEVGDDSI
ncbi:hypothetical protein QM806_04350 [Rhodococcus sp. IEGM 1351]|uniref:hypothetical protein n=1 Tax=Rhodococcus sp. IEGM 1351 TaxID=3047089 RepID=UPI0024B6B729|nr:hypothetical protein [Rhodococcus sp. IEGM 1351]MDI9934685.1 hypothetical protein [Rhodococcus sp. IEGM 1351]